MFLAENVADVHGCCCLEFALGASMSVRMSVRMLRRIGSQRTLPLPSSSSVVLVAAFLSFFAIVQMLANRDERIRQRCIART